MIAQELEVSLHMAFMEARQKRHEFITVEHLLLAMLDNPSAAEVLRACAANVEELHRVAHLRQLGVKARPFAHGAFDDSNVGDLRTNVEMHEPQRIGPPFAL